MMLSSREGLLTFLGCSIPMDYMSKYYSSACKSDRFGLDKLGILSWIVASAGNFADIAFLAAADGEL